MALPMASAIQPAEIIFGKVIFTPALAFICESAERRVNLHRSTVICRKQALQFFSTLHCNFDQLAHVVLVIGRLRQHFLVVGRKISAIFLVGESDRSMGRR